ncbi:FAD binding [Gracilaria domingensis]|nr:FAD binding [Gracilaria domingensis]
MKKFVEAKPIRLPTSTRLESLVVHVGRVTPSGGVVFLGDAAHSFPPDVGQGVNSAFEDVEVFVNVLDTFGSDGTIEDIIIKYEMERVKDIKGLLEYVRRSTGFAAERLSWARMMSRVVSLKLRGTMSKRFPKWFSPSLVELNGSDCSYSEAIRLYDETTVRLWACGVSAVALPIMAGLGHALICCLISVACDRAYMRRMAVMKKWKNMEWLSSQRRAVADRSVAGAQRVVIVYARLKTAVCGSLWRLSINIPLTGWFGAQLVMAPEQRSTEEDDSTDGTLSQDGDDAAWHHDDREKTGRRPQRRREAGDCDSGVA